LDSSFGDGGRLTTDFFDGFDPQNRDEANAVAVQPDGKIVAVGSTAFDGSADFAVARYLAR
jgi:hypothetical protein